ncbi:winged helix-turn-helix domain-containing protein [Streptomyces sp. NBC_00019]|uniref:helix-turn-helix domain-containing protein n=1 Tax=Streptomyces sp. NBC_00019 TaxID=2975623 RepID=UPI003864D889
MADPDLPPVLLYPLHHSPGAPQRADGHAPLHALLGTTRTVILRAAATGATTTEAARHAGVTPTTASHHTTVLRDAGLITSHRHANTVLHALTPLGASLLQQNGWHRVH